jgi:hypothetical protein
MNNTKTPFNTASSEEDDEQNNTQPKEPHHQRDGGQQSPAYFLQDDEHEAEASPHQASRLMRLQAAREDRQQGSQATGQRESTAGKSYTAAAAAEGKSQAALTKNALKNRRWRHRKKLKMQQVEDDLAIAELEREQLKNEQTRLREKMIVLLNQHQIRLGRSHVLPTHTTMINQCQPLGVQSAASSVYRPGPLPPHVVRNTAPLDESARAEGNARFCVADLQQHELDTFCTNRAVNSMLFSAYQQQSHRTKEKDQQNIDMRYAAAAGIARERIKHIAIYQQYGCRGGTGGRGSSHPAAGPSNVVARQNQHKQEYRAAATVYTRHVMAHQQQQFTSPLFAVPPPPQLQPDAQMHGRNLSHLIHGGVGRLPPMRHHPPIFNSHNILPFMQSLSGISTPFEFAPPTMVMWQEARGHSSEVQQEFNHPALARKNNETSPDYRSQRDAVARRDQGSNSSEDGADDLDQKPRAA